MNLKDIASFGAWGIAAVWLGLISRAGSGSMKLGRLTISAVWSAAALIISFSEGS